MVMENRIDFMSKQFRSYTLYYLVITCLALLPLEAQVPRFVNYQGRVSVGATPFDGTGQFKFALVNSDGTVTFWSNDGTSGGGSEPTAALSLPVAKGLYSVYLGDSTQPGMSFIPPSIFTNPDV